MARSIALGQFCPGSSLSLASQGEPPSSEVRMSLTAFLYPSHGFLRPLGFSLISLPTPGDSTGCPFSRE
jgi:hypothetical protein